MNVWVAAAVAAMMQPSIVVVLSDDVEITEDCTVLLSEGTVADRNGDGVVKITGDGITVDFGGGRLLGADPGAAPDGFTGVGVEITGDDVTISNLDVSGYKTGIHALGADGLTIQDCDVSGNFRQRLRSTAAREDPRDWLVPHHNDMHQWRDLYGAGIYVQDSDRVTVRRVRARRGQNGIVLDRSDRAVIYDNDCSFLSGWGLAMYRSDHANVSRNAFDFCVRGYSHDVYNRGQDSAGIMLFEQCSWNSFVENSATHCGDGFFAFAGQEALGQVTVEESARWHRRRGCNKNLLTQNDFSYAAAHGVEITFSFDNTLVGNTIFGNAICGFWGGYSQDTNILGNRFEDNGRMGYGDERGGVNIEHGHRNRIEHNTFVRNVCGVRLWWDEDPLLSALPWSVSNARRDSQTTLKLNTFDGDETAIELRREVGVRILGFSVDDVGTQIDADDESEFEVVPWNDDWTAFRVSPSAAVGSRRPRGARSALVGRDSIIMTEWGPWDHASVAVRRLESDDERGTHRYELLGAAEIDAVETLGRGRHVIETSEVVDGRPRITVTGPADPGVHAYRYRLRAGEKTVEIRGALVNATWALRVFPWTADPRNHLASWRRQASGTAGVDATAPALRFDFGNGAPGDDGVIPELAAATLPSDHFGTIATTEITFPRGRWQLRSRSDDGVRIWLDGEPVIDDWTWHPATVHTHEFEVLEPERLVSIRVEHFELDGNAVLEVGFESLN